MQGKLFDLKPYTVKPYTPSKLSSNRVHADMALYQDSILSLIRRGTFVSFVVLQTALDYYTIADWWELHLAGYVITTNGEAVVTPLGIEYLTERGLI